MTPAADNTPAVRPEQGGGAVTSYFKGIPADDILNRIMGFSMAIKDAKFITKEARGDAASVFFMINMAQDLGITWTHGLRSIYMTPNGKAGLQGDILLAVLLSKKFKVKILQSTNELAEVWMSRPDDSMEFSDTFTIEDAKKAGIFGQYGQYPKDKLRWRAVARVARIVAADVIGGLYITEELQDMEDVAADQQRADQISHGGTEEFVVARKSPEPVATKPAEPEVIDVKPAEPVKTEPVKETPAPVQQQAEPVKAEAPAASAPGPVAVERSPEQQAYLSEMTKAQDILLNAGLNPTKANKAIKDFLTSYHGVATIKSIKTADALQAGFPALHISLNNDLDAFRNDPAGAGRIAKHKMSGSIVESALEKLGWAPEVIQAAVANQKKWELLPEDYIRVAHATGLMSLNSDEAAAYLRVALITRHAHLIIDMRDEFKMGVVQTVKELEFALRKSIEEIDEKTLSSGIQLAMRLKRDEQSKSPEPAAQAAASVPEDEELPFD